MITWIAQMYLSPGDTVIIAATFSNPMTAAEHAGRWLNDLNNSTGVSDWGIKPPSVRIFPWFTNE